MAAKPWSQTTDSDVFDIGGWFGVMPVHLRGSGALGLESVTVLKGNPGVGITATLELSMQPDPATGVPHSMMLVGQVIGVRRRSADRPL